MLGKHAARRIATAHLPVSFKTWPVHKSRNQYICNLATWIVATENSNKKMLGQVFLGRAPAVVVKTASAKASKLP